jgi:hypothetical protein
MLQISYAGSWGADAVPPIDQEALNIALVKALFAPINCCPPGSSSWKGISATEAAKIGVSLLIWGASAPAGLAFDLGDYLYGRYLHTNLISCSTDPACVPAARLVVIQKLTEARVVQAVHFFSMLVTSSTFEPDQYNRSVIADSLGTFLSEGAIPKDSNTYIAAIAALQDAAANDEYPVVRGAALMALQKIGTIGPTNGVSATDVGDFNRQANRLLPAGSPLALAPDTPFGLQGLLVAKIIVTKMFPIIPPLLGETFSGLLALHATDPGLIAPVIPELTRYFKRAADILQSNRRKSAALGIVAGVAAITAGLVVSLRRNKPNQPHPLQGARR